MHNRWSFSVNYTYAFADGVASDQAFGANPNGLEFLPNQELRSTGTSGTRSP